MDIWKKVRRAQTGRPGRWSLPQRPIYFEGAGPPMQGTKLHILIVFSMFLQNQSVSYGQTGLSPMDKPGFLPWPRYSRVFGRNRATNASKKPSNSQCFFYVLRAQFVCRRLKPTNSPPAPFICRIDCFSAPAILRLLRLLE